MNNPTVSNPNDFKVVEFHNSNDFTFTPEMGCMYDSRPISGITGAPGINGGESLTLPYHIAHQLATNLAKYVMTRGASATPTVDAQGNPMVAAIWDTAKLEEMKNSYMTELYTEDRPVAQSETDRLMAKVEEYKAMVDKLMENKKDEPVAAPTQGDTISNESEFKDKQDVMAELDKRGIKHDKRENKEELEKLLVA